MTVRTGTSQALQHGPLHLLKRNRSAAVAEASALQWLLALPPSTHPLSKPEIDAELATERNW
jgi:hypothetical protein